MTRYYCAYGSNLNVKQMAERCPESKPVGIGMLYDMELEYRGNETGYYATVTPKVGESVPVVVYTLSALDEKKLDQYEHVPEIYTKEMVDVTVDGNVYTSLIYIMRDSYHHGIPSQAYYLRILQGYRDYGLHEETLYKSLSLAYERT